MNPPLDGTAGDRPSPIPCQKALFDLPDDVAYLRCAAMSPGLRAAQEAGAAGLAHKARPWRLHAGHYFEDVETARGLFAQLIGAAADDIAIVPSASYGIATAAANLPLAPGQSIVLLAEQFPSNVYAWRELAKANGGRVVTVARPSDDDWTAAVLEAIDDDTAIVTLGQCHWADGGLIDLTAVAARARQVGAALALDVTQSAGVSPLSVAELDPDFLVAVTYKWLLGPYSFGFLYVAPRHQDGRPIEHNWVGRANAQDTNNISDYVDAYQPGARRFDVGERGNFVSIPQATAGIRQILDWGVDNIAHTIAPMTAEIGARATDLGFRVPAADRHVGHIIGLRMPGGLPADLNDRLSSAGVYISIRGDSIRVAPHLYNDAGDIDRLFEVLSAVAA